MNDFNICVVAGTHGNEYPLGAMVHKQLQESYPGQFFPLIGNPKAVEIGSRFIDSDLNRSFNGESRGYEADRAEEIKSIFNSEGFTHVIDIHTSPTTDNIVGVIASGCDGIKTYNLINCILSAHNLVTFPNNSKPHSLVGAFGNGGLGLECPRYDYEYISNEIVTSIAAFASGLVLPKTIRTNYLIDSKIPIDLDLPNGQIRDFEEIPVIGGYSFVGSEEYKKAGADHQGMRALKREKIRI